LPAVPFGGVGSPAGFGYSERGSLSRDRDAMSSRIEQLCEQKGLKMTEQRRIIARVLSDSADHPDVEQVYRRATEIDPRISIATVYRTVRLFEEANILARHDFGDGRARYEEMPSPHHDHLIDLQTGQVIEFRNDEIEKLQHLVAEQLGYDLVGHRLELYAVASNRTRKGE
jgi:Fur family ferric uptake transcriptional regulator